MRYPPFISWLFWIGNLFNNVQFASRIPVVLLGHLTIWIWCGLIAETSTPKEKRILFWLLSLHTLVGFGSMVANPDVPFLFFWSLSLYLYQKSIQDLKSPLWPVLLGCSLGFGFASKYLTALFVPIVLIHLLLSGNWRQMKWYHFVYPFVFGALCSLPVWLWNYQNEWKSFAFQLHHGLGKKDWKPQWTGDFLAGTLMLLFPPFLYIFFKEKIYFLLTKIHVIAFSFLFFFFFYTTFGGDTELNWPLALYPSFFYLIALNLKGIKSFISYCVFFGAIGFTALFFCFFKTDRPLHERLREGALYQSLFEKTRNYTPLYTSTYQTASYFWFISKSPVYKLRYSSRADEYDLMADSQPSENLIYFIKEGYQKIPAQQLELFNFTKEIDLEKGFEIYKGVRK